MAPGQPGQHRHQPLAALLVDHAGDFVGDQQRRLAGQRGGHRQPLQLATGQPAGVAIGHPVEAHLGEQSVDVGVRARRQTPDDVVGHPGAQHLTLRVLHHHRGAAEPAQTHRTGAFDGARRGSRPDSTSISVVLPDPLAPVTARCSPGCTVSDTGPSASWSAVG